MLQLEFMKSLRAMSLILLLCLQEETGYSFPQQRLMEFQAKLREIEASSPIQPHSPTPVAQLPETKQNGRVFYPIGYGADPTGEQESSDAVLNALNDAFQVQKGEELVPGVNDLGGVQIDFQGGNYKISKPIRFPASGGGNVLIKGGTLRASATFPGDRHLIELWSPNSHQLLAETDSIQLHQVGFHDKKDKSDSIYYEGITFRDIVFDSGYKGGGILIIDSARIRITNCFFLHFTTEGILVQKGHETFISSCFLGQHSTVGNDPGEKYYTGTAIDLASNDNAITDVVIFSAAIGVLLRGQANILTGVHCYNKATYWGGTGILVKQNAALTRIDNSYLDFNAIVLEDPVQVHVTNGLFLGGGNIVLKAIDGKISGVTFVDNMFTGDSKNSIPIVQLDGTFTDINQVVIDQNNAIGMNLKSTVGKLTVVGSGRKWVADFSSVLVFPNRIGHFQYSFYVQGTSDSGFPVHAVTNVVNNSVLVESDKTVNGVVSVIVDQYNTIGESNVVV